MIQAGEGEAVAWSYLAAIECGIDPKIVFHAKGFGGKENAKELMNGLKVGQHFGYNGMMHSKMCERIPYNFTPPKMLKWVQD